LNVTDGPVGGAWYPTLTDLRGDWSPSRFRERL